MTIDDIVRADEILSGKPAEPQEVVDLASRLQSGFEFTRVRKLLSPILKAESNPELHGVIRRMLAFSISQDGDLPAELRFDTAIEVLGKDLDLTTTNDQMSLGVAGAIYKGKWETFIVRQDLETALGFFLRAYQCGVAADSGYSGAFAALLLSVLASLEQVQEKLTGLPSETVPARVRQAAEIRQNIIEKLTPINSNDWRSLLSLGAAHFGLRQYDQAAAVFRRAKALEGFVEREYESVAHELTTIASLLTMADGSVDPKARAVIADFLDQHGAGASSSFLGKAGLALSGGGFRASLFHIGVLAKLAELDMLRHVEVLSCVSGGSIIGAYYYLEVRRLLQSKVDGEITRQDYVDIVKRIEVDFVTGIQTNIRMRIISNLMGNIRMALNGHYTRTERAGRLYEEKLYSKITGSTDEIWLNELKILPMGEADGFHPVHHNWKRRAKVPILLLNATTLNTGHNWQFNTSWMGEPPAGVDSKVDGNSRLRRLRYSEAPPNHRRVRLGHAVAASACVPGALEPLVLADLYPGFTVRLVDGGVFDNQGTASLLDQNCTVVLCSDASGQMSDDKVSSESPLNVVLRTSSILQARLRVAQSRDLTDRRKGNLLRGLMFLHMKLDLQSRPVNWIGASELQEQSSREQVVDSSDRTSYGMRRDIQAMLAGVRTDLDSFHDLEASALMISGYRMTESELPRSVPGFPLDNSNPVAWRFLELEKSLNPGSSQFAKASKALNIASMSAFKIWYLIPALKLAGLGAAVAIVVGVLWACFHYSSTPLVTAGTVGIAIVSMGATAVLGKHAVAFFRARTTYHRVLIGLAVAILAWLLTWIHLLVFDPLYLRYGKRDRFTV